MTAVTISSTQGVNYSTPTSYTVETTAPTSGFDFEVRYNLLNSASPTPAPITKLDLVKFLQAVIYGLESGQTFFAQSVNGLSDFVGPQI